MKVKGCASFKLCAYAKIVCLRKVFFPYALFFVLCCVVYKMFKWLPYRFPNGFDVVASEAGPGCMNRCQMDGKNSFSGMIVMRH